MGQLETSIRNRILGDTAIAALIGDRLSPLVLAQTDTRPYATYQVTDRKTEGTLDGHVDDYRRAEFEVGIYADTYGAVMNLSDLVRDRLDLYGGTVDGIEFAPIEFDSETDVEQATPEGEELPVFLRVLTFKTLFRIL